jgi:hypothetical protein
MYDDDMVVPVTKQISAHFVGVGWVARYYGVPKLRVYRAIHRGKLFACLTADGSYLLDKRSLPDEFPQ